MVYRTCKVYILSDSEKNMDLYQAIANGQYMIKLIQFEELENIPPVFFFFFSFRLEFQ